MLYLGVALLDAGRYQDAVNEMLDAAADAQLTGLDRSFGGYLDALAAEGLIRLGRWAEAEHGARLTAKAPRPFRSGESASRSPAPCSPPVAATATAALTLLAEAEARPSIPSTGGSSIEPRRRCYLALGDWAEAAAIAERALATTRRPRCGRPGSSCSASSPRSSSRSMLAPDASRRRRRHVARLRSGSHGAATLTVEGDARSLDSAAHLAHAAAALTRLGDSDPDAWAEAAERWAAPR